MFGVITLQTLAAYEGFDLIEQQTYSLAEEAAGDEDTDERKELDKSLNKTYGNNYNSQIVSQHFTEYFQNLYPVVCEVLYPPPRS